MWKTFGLAIVLCHGWMGTALRADVIEVEGTVKEINAEDRTLTLARRRGKFEKVLELEVSDKATIKAGDTDADLADIKEGDDVAVKYDSKLEIVTELVKGGASEKNYAKLLRSKFAASKATLDPKTGVLTLAYDFKNPEQLKDFKAKEGAAIAGKGLLRVSAAEAVTHVVEFTEGSISGRFAYGNIEGNQALMAVTGASQLRLDLDQFGALFMHILANGQFLARKNIGHKRPLAIQWDLTDSKTRAVINGEELAGARAGQQEAGQFVLNGGNGGLTVSGLIISGIPREDWFKEFMDK